VRYHNPLIYPADIDECSSGSHSCLVDTATCTNTIGSYICACKPGYVGDGKTSCTVIAPGTRKMRAPVLSSNANHVVRLRFFVRNVFYFSSMLL